MKEPIKYLVILSLLLSLTSCASFCKDYVTTEYVYVKQEIPIQEHPKALKLYNVDFDAVSYQNLDEYLAANKFRYGHNVFIAMDVRDYENLSLNTAELQRYIEQQKALIKYYEERIEKPLPPKETE